MLFLQRAKTQKLNKHAVPKTVIIRISACNPTAFKTSNSTCVTISKHINLIQLKVTTWCGSTTSQVPFKSILNEAEEP